MLKAKKIILASLILLFSTIIPTYSKTLIYCSEGSPEHFAPSLTTSGATIDAAAYTLFNKLIEHERGTTKLIPGLAESWKISNDGLTYTFFLRKNVKFHQTPYFKPSRNFNADDVLFTFNRQWKKKNTYHKISGGSYTLFESMGMPKFLSDIKKIDDYTVEFTIKKPDAAFLSNLSMHFGSILSKEYADFLLEKGTPEKIDTQPVGTGPFILVDYIKDSSIRYKKNPDYWKGEGHIDHLVFSITTDSAVRWAKVKKGECHLMSYPNPADLDEMRKNSYVKLHEKPGLNIGYLAFNVEHDILKNKLVRQALNMAVDKDSIIKAVFQGGAQKAKTPMSPLMWSYNNEIEDYSYNLEKAKNLLAKAGYPKGFKIDMWAMPVQRPYNPNAERMAEIIQEDWKKIGVDVNISTREWGEYLKLAKEGKYETLFLGMLTGNDPDTYMHLQLSCDSVNGFNTARWCDKSYDDLVNAAKRITDINERTILYKKAQTIFKEEAPWVPIAHSKIYEPVRNEVIDYKIDPTGYHNFYGVGIE